MILVVEKKANGSTLEVALDAARGDGLCVQVDPPGGYCEPLPLADLISLELEQHDENPGLRTTVSGGLQRVYPLDPKSVLHVGWEAGEEEGLVGGHMQNVGRHAALVISELKALSLELNQSDLNRVDPNRQVV